MEWITDNAKETQNVATLIAKNLRGGEVLALVGPLGAGKTTFVQGFREALLIPSSTRVTSPTFTLIQEYIGGRLPLYHVDLYRLEKKEDLDYLGLEEYFSGKGVTVVEWADRFPDVFPSKTDWYEFEVLSAEKRIIRKRENGSPPLKKGG